MCSSLPSPGIQPSATPLKTQCPLCLQTQLWEILDRRIPVHQNLRFGDPEAAKVLTRGDLRLVICEHCGFVFNQMFDLSLLRYGLDYDSQQDASPSFNAYVDELITYMLQEISLRNASILEIGCGKGQFLKALIENTAFNNTGFGFDPSYRGPETLLDGRLKFSQDYYGPGYEHIPADIVICRHVLGHVPEPVAMLKTVREALKHSSHARLFFETPSVNWMFENQVNWDFFYEYCAYYSPASLQTLFETAGFQVERIRSGFGEQYLWVEASIPPQPLSPTFTPANTLQLAVCFRQEVKQGETHWVQRLEDLGIHGEIAVWGAGAKGCTFANLLDPDGKRIACVIDSNPSKQGGFLPGTGHPIVSLEEAVTRGVRYAILLNPNYRTEIQCLLDERDCGIELVS